MRFWHFALGGTLIVGALLALILGLNSVSFVDSSEVGFRFDARTGKIAVLSRTGWFSKHPVLESIRSIDTRPKQVCINANSRVLNCKLVRFNPNGLETFIQWHGRDAGVDGGVYEILKSYAYDGTGRDYPFLDIIQEIGPNQMAIPREPKPPVPTSSATDDKP